MVVILKFVYVMVIFVSLFLMAINVNAIPGMPCINDVDCEKYISPVSGYQVKCIDGNCERIRI
uniref:Late nodulin-like protein n=1 Tax=Astragalus sinicus TaxID=47065 RepID=Q07A36_ASTSI|nr:late nodulin-like protein [Astragalus sinicus]